MSKTFPDSVYPGRSVYHKVYGSHDGGYDPSNVRWRYWTVCNGGPKHRGNPVPVTKWSLISVERAEREGFRPCARCGFDGFDGEGEA